MPRFFWVFLIAVAAVATTAQGRAQAPAPAGGNMLVYFGTYTTGAKSKGIYVVASGYRAGTLSPPSLPPRARARAFSRSIRPRSSCTPSTRSNTFGGQARREP